MSKILSIAGAIGLSFLMFLGMTIMIKPDLVKSEPKPNPTVIIHYDDTDDDPADIIRVPPKLVKLEPPKVIANITDSPKPKTVQPRYTQVVFNRDRVAVNSTGIRLWGDRGSSEATPKVRINPRYPRIAATKGIEGFVTLAFDINETGGTENIRIIEQKPRGMFDKAARKALAKWKYQPKMENSKAIAQPGQKVTLEFNLEQELL